MSGPPNPRVTPLQSELEGQSKSDDGTPASLAGFIARGGQVKPIPGDVAPYSVGLATASADGRTGVAPAAADGDKVVILADRYGRLWTAGTAPELYSSTTNPAGEASRVVAGAHVFVEALAYNGSGVAAFLMIFDAAALPPNGTVPAIAAVDVASGASVAIDAGPGGLSFVNGIVAVLSSTPFSLTAVNPNSFTIVYR